MASLRANRVAKERQKIAKQGLPPGIDLISGEDMREWQFDIRVLDGNPLYRDQTFRLKIVFSDSYPIEPPEATFESGPDRNIPMHPHIYSNGIICLDLLGNQGWSPVQSAESVCMSIQSMLTSNSKDERPPDNDHFVMGNRRRPRDIDFVYHDNSV
ncbi:ubiquitin-conjugating enzyme [Cordyceps javanica]|uniref:Ubiquitin-conjugating enzyme n=1 Tax=Cordyceps javanica TaxID=43265 RepID=A0A545VD75_9HYPO|nr:ubiquitin-conjugating enzyme [Cordyceps javanica]TQW10651.1 ubiquitin-conjugating enzyme [Cordyceps javanica]